MLSDWSHNGQMHTLRLDLFCERVVRNVQPNGCMGGNKRKIERK